MLPNFIIIGAQKAGSTFLHRCLAEHPDIFMPAQEVPFFEDPDYNEVGIEYLELLLSGASNQSAVGIKRPNYLAKPECPARIYRHIPDARLIAVLRHPIERAVSAYYHYMKVGFLPVRPLEEGLSGILGGEYHSRYPRSSEILNFGFYSRHLERYLGRFDMSQILIVLHEDLTHRPSESIARACIFLGVDGAFTPPSLSARPKPGVYSLGRLRWLALRNPMIYDYDDQMTRLRPKQSRVIFETLASKGVVAVDRLLLAPVLGRARPELSPALSDRLLDLYAEDVRRLELLLQRDLPAWHEFTTGRAGSQDR